MESQQRTQKLDTIISVTIAKHPDVRKVYTGDGVPDKIVSRIIRKFSPIDPSAEEIKLAAVYPVLWIFTLGIVITDRNVYYKLMQGYAGLTKSGRYAFNDIEALRAEHKVSHACHQGGNPGPVFRINGVELGWLQPLMMMSEEDEDCLIEVFNRLNEVVGAG